MSLNKEALDKLIMEVMGELSEDFTSNAFAKGFGTYTSGDTQSGPNPLGGTVGAQGIFDTFKDKAPDNSRFSKADITYYKDNPEEITTPIQQKLIAISRAGGGGNATAYDNETARRKQSIFRYLMFGIGKAKAENIASHYAEQFKEADPEISKGLAAQGRGQKAAKAKASKALLQAALAELGRLGKTVPNSTPPSHLGQKQMTPYKDRYERWKFHSDPTNRTELMAMATEAEAALAALDQKVDDAGKKKQTISNPEFKSQRGETGAFPPEQVAVVKRLLTGSTIEERIKKVAAISTKYYNAATGKGDTVALQMEAISDPAKILTEIQLLDLFNTMVKEIDSGSGAYVFEYFLGLISGGQVLGKDKTASGQMGAADFKMASGELGSAKFYKKGSGVTQAVSGYVDMLTKAQEKDSNTTNVSVTYVVGLKKQDASQVNKKALGTSDPARIIGVEIFTPKVVWDGTNFEVNGDVVRHSDKIKLDSNLGASKGVVYITEMRTRTFREMISKAIGKTNNVMKELFQYFQGYFDMLQQADESAKVYVAEEDAGKRSTRAQSVYNSLQGANQSFTKIKAGIDNAQDGRDLDMQMNTGADMVENKKNEINSLKALDKLIERVILYKNTEEK